MPTTFGTKLFEITALLTVAAARPSTCSTFFLMCKENVKDTGDLLLLRDWIFEDLGAPYMWIVMLSVVE